MGKQKAIKTLFSLGVLVFGLFMFGAVARAGWPIVAIPIAVTEGAQGHYSGSKIISDQAGGSIIVWEDDRSGKQGFYAQKVDFNGNIKWKKNGVLIHQGDITVKYEIVADGYGGFWFSTAEEPKLYLHHFNKNGESVGYNEQTFENSYSIKLSLASLEHKKVLLGFSNATRILDPVTEEVESETYNYIQKFSSAGDLLDSKLVASTKGEGDTGWHEMFNNLISSGSGAAFFITEGWALSMDNSRVIVRKYDSNLNKLSETSMDTSNWPQTGDCPELDVFSDGQSGLLFIYFTGGMTGNLIYQKVDSSGNAVFPDYQVLADANRLQQDPAITVDYDKNIFIVWEDARITSKTEVQYGFEHDIYAQRMDKDGKLLWQKNGIPISNKKDKNEIEPVITNGGLTDAIIAWTAYEDVYISGGGTKHDVYIQKINKDGALQWSENPFNGGVPLKPSEGNQNEPAIMTDYKGGAFVTWTDKESLKIKPDIYAQQIGANGIMAQKVLYFSNKQAKKKKFFSFAKQWAKFKIIRAPFKEKYYWAQISKKNGKIPSSLGFDRSYLKPYWQVETNLNQIKDDYEKAMKKQVAKVTNCKNSKQCTKKSLKKYQKQLSALRKKNFLLEITLKYTDAKLRTSGLKENDLALYYYNKAGKTWTKLSSAKQNSVSNEFAVNFSYFKSSTNYFVIEKK